MPVKSSQPIWVVIIMVLLAGFSRLIPHPPNFTAITAMALLAGATLPRLSLALVVPLLGLLIGDWVYGFHSTILSVYISMLAVSGLAFFFLKGKSYTVVASSSFFASLGFWLVTNFAVWFQMDLYSKNFAGLLTCYTAALPFLENQILGDLFFTAVVFSVYALLTKFSSAKTYSST